MTMRLLLLLIAFSLSACTKIQVDDAELENPEDVNITGYKISALDTATRKAIGAMNPDDLIAVFTDDGVTLYGAPDKAFKVVPKEQLDSKSMDKAKIEEKEPVNNAVNNVVIKTFVNSPACQLIVGAGYRFWYPSNCP